MNHDYSHCSSYTESCPSTCFRAQLVEDLQPHMPVSWSDFKNTEECPLYEKKLPDIPVEWIKNWAKDKVGYNHSAIARLLDDWAYENK